MSLEQMSLPVAPGMEPEPLPVASEQMPLPMCDGFELSSVALEQMPLALCGGFNRLPVGARADANTRGA